MASDLIKHVSDSTFEADVLKSGKPVLLFQMMGRLDHRFT